MATKSDKKDAPPEGQSIEELQQRYQALHTRKIQAETTLASATERLEELKREAREQYQTDDLDQLRKMLDEMNAENERKRSAYQEQLTKIEDDLATVEQTFAAEEDPGAETGATS